MNDKNTYTGNKVQNQFTAYLLGFIRGKRRDYLAKKVKISNSESPLEDLFSLETGVSIEELLEQGKKDGLLMLEARGHYPDWQDISNDRLMEALLTLREDERNLIYQHVFEEKSFREMGLINGLSEERVKGIYYYAIRKIRKMMGGKKNGF